MTSLLLDLPAIAESQTAPPPFERGAPMWNDPYISTQMLRYHLDPTTDAASRRPESNDRVVQWLASYLDLTPGKSVLDLGCGPGLCTSRFASLGLDVTGVDYSQNSIDYATENDPSSTYIMADYTQLSALDTAFDLITIIHGDFCVLSPSDLDTLLPQVRAMLKPGGAFAFDVTRATHHHYLKDHRHWSVSTGEGFWKADPHVVIEQGFDYGDDLTMHQYIVIEGDGTQTLYRNWYQDYTRETILPLMTEAGFTDVVVFGDLMGAPYTEDGTWCGVIARP